MNRTTILLVCAGALLFGVGALFGTDQTAIVDSINSPSNVILGSPLYPGYVAIVAPDSGTQATQPVQGVVGGVPLPSDTTPGDLNSTVQHYIVATTAGAIVDSGTFVGVNVCNEGTLTAWWQLFNGQNAIDAGGTNDAGTVPTIIPLRVPAGACASLNEPQNLAAKNSVWYSSSTQGLLTVDASPQSMSVDYIGR